MVVPSQKPGSNLVDRYQKIFGESRKQELSVLNSGSFNSALTTHYTPA